MPVSVKSSERGSALIIVAVLMVFAGFVLILGLGPFHTQDTQDHILRTAQRQQFLIKQLSAYVQRENRLPCPADPSLDPQTDPDFGFARGSAWIANHVSGDPNDAGSCDANPEGIIPFRTLGLEPYDAQDGWGREMTYRISPVLNNPFIGGDNVNTARIFMRCRRFPWFYDYGHSFDPAQTPVKYNNTYNVYPDKALFCCPSVNASNAADIVVSATTGGAALQGIGRFPGGEDDLMNTMVQPPLAAAAPADGNQELFAFVIVSHGTNGVGAFVPGQPAAARLGGVAGTDEQTNFSNTGKFVDHQMILASGQNYFDDMVVWRTQIGLMAELNNASCYTPWR